MKGVKKMSVYKKYGFVTPILITAVFSLVILAVFTGIMSYQSVYRESINTMYQQNRALISRMEGWLTIKIYLAENNAMMLRDADVNRDMVIRHFSEQAETMEDVSVVFAGFPDGSIIFSGDWEVSDDVYACERPWYIAAAETPGEVVFSRPFWGGATKEMAFSAVRTISNYDDSLGVVALSLPFSAMISYIEQDNGTQHSHSYSFIIDDLGNILFHPDPVYAPLDDFNFRNINEAVNGTHAGMLESIQANGSYIRDGIIHVGAPMESTNWYVITSVPAYHIFSNVLPTVYGLIATSLFALLALIGAWLMVRRTRLSMKREREAKEINERLINSAPFVVNIWAGNDKLIATNQQAAITFGFSDKEDYITHFSKLSPEYQPCGTLSSIKAVALVDEAFRQDEPVKCEWMHQTLDGEPVPTELTLVRFAREGKYMVAAYALDLRQLRDAEEFTQLLMDRSPLCVEMFDDERNLIYCNQKMLDVTGVDTFEEYQSRFDEFSGTHQPEGTASDEKLTAMFNEAMSEGFARFEWTHKTANGEMVPYESQFIRTVRQNKRNIISYSLDVRDIKAAIAKAYEADERAALMMGAAPISCFMIRWINTDDGEMKFEAIDFNQAALDLFGFTTTMQVFERFNDILPTPPEGFTKTEMISQKAAIAMENGFDRFEFIHQSLDGELIPCEVTLVRIEYQGEPALLCFQNDLRPVRAAIEKERNARELIQAYLDAAPFFVEIWDKNLNLVECNDSVVNLFGLSDKEEYIRRYAEFSPEFQPCGTPSLEKAEAYVEIALRDGRSHMEWVHLGSNGELIPVDCSMARIQNGEDYAVVTYNQDLRPIKEALEKEREAAEENQAKTRFLARMSHEVRTPMNSVMGIAEIELQKSSHPAETEEAFQRIYNSSRLLLSIINDILDLSKVEAGKMEIIPAVYETASLIADTVQLNLMYIGSKHIEFSLEVDEKLPVYLIGDELRIKQILNNLISNAFKYTFEGEVNLIFRVEESQEHDDVTVIISVSDSGQGMSKEQLDKLFEIEYTRFNMEQNRAIEGSGLGMSITHSIVKMMNGDIKVESEAGKGSVFTVSIPQKTKGDQILGKDAALSLQNLEATKMYLKRMDLHSHEPMPYGRVLVVDDVESNLYVAKGFLIPYKLTIETVDSAKKAIALIKEGQEYDIIFMDHMMPEMDGVEAVKILRDMGYIRPIVALTANATFGASQIFMDNGFSDFISKPLDPRKMDNCLMDFVYKKQTPEVIAATRAKYPNLCEDNEAYEDDEKDVSNNLIESFLIDARNSLAILEPIIHMEELGGDDFKMYIIQTHAMKSALNNIGRRMLSNVAGTLEEAGRNKDLDIIKNQTVEFLKNVKEIVISLSDQEEIEESDTEQDSAFVSEQLMAISTACEEYDITGVQDLINALKENLLTKQTKIVLSEIEKHLLFSDYDDAALLAKKAANELSNRNGE